MAGFHRRHLLRRILGYDVAALVDQMELARINTVQRYARSLKLGVGHLVDASWETASLKIGV
jgi:hypothetical protein